MDRLGMVQAESKVCRPAQAMVWLGIQFNTLDMSMAIPKTKLAEVMECVIAWGDKRRATRKEMQSLLGLLNFVASVAPPTRLFTNRMLDDLREAPQAGAATFRVNLNRTSAFSLSCCPCLMAGASWARPCCPTNTKWSLMPASRAVGQCQAISTMRQLSRKRSVPGSTQLLTWSC